MKSHWNLNHRHWRSESGPGRTLVKPSSCFGTAGAPLELADPASHGKPVDCVSLYTKQAESARATDPGPPGRRGRKSMAAKILAQLVAIAALLSSAIAWHIPLIAKVRSPSPVQNVFGHTLQFQANRRLSRVVIRMSGAEQKPETSGSFLQGALLRIIGPSALSFMIALEGHIQITGPWSKLDLVDALMAFTEITVLSEFL
jgi:hypothetical protein